MEIPEGFSNALELLRVIEQGDVTLPEQRALELPKNVSDSDDSTIAMFLDEFQTRSSASGGKSRWRSSDAPESRREL